MFNSVSCYFPQELGEEQEPWCELDDVLQNNARCEVTGADISGQVGVGNRGEEEGMSRDQKGRGTDGSKH